MLISGGKPEEKKVEMFIPRTGKICQLPDLPDLERNVHSFCGRLLCGGSFSSTSTQQSCLLFNPLTGNFSSTPVILRHRRHEHLCWEVGGEGGDVLLMGGTHHQARRNTELVTADGASSSASFDLQYDTWLSINININDNQLAILQ